MLQSGGVLRVVVRLVRQPREPALHDGQCVAIHFDVGRLRDGADRIHALDADGDDAVVGWFGRIDFGSESVKALPYVYAGVERATDAPS